MSDDRTVRKFRKELNSGAIALVLLSVIDAHQEAMYGYEIGKHLEDLANGSLPMNQAAIYPVLRSLERQGLLGSQSIPSSSGPPRKYYQLTPAGKKAASEWPAVWKETTSFVDSILEMNDADATKPRSPLSRKTRARAKTKGGS